VEVVGMKRFDWGLDATKAVAGLSVFAVAAWVLSHFLGELVEAGYVLTAFIAGGLACYVVQRLDAGARDRDES
jgi:uncharacterized membrane protein YiaA